MGNLRSYSKGCRTCVKRRVKCDGRHPSCGRCEKGGFNCEGFAEATFINTTDQVKKDQIKKRSKETSHTAVSRDLFPLPSHDEIYVLFTVENLCKGPSALMYRNIFSYDPSGSQSHQPMMNQCLLAQATAFYGIHNRENRILRDGMRQYGRGLSMLRNTLGEDHCTVTTEIIVSAFALSVVESIMPTGKASWLSHILGLERLFASHRPSITEPRTRLDSALLETCRPFLIIASFFTQTPSVMREPRWKVHLALPSLDGSSILSQTSVTATDINLLIGILAELPPLFLQCNELVQLVKANSLPPSLARVSDLWSRASELHQQLLLWQEKWNPNPKNEAFETLPVTKVNSARIPPWTNVFYFSNAALAIVFNMYHSVVILLNSIPIHLIDAGITDPSSSILSNSDCSISTKTSVHSICRSVEYYLQFLQPSEAPVDYYLFFPMHVARRACIQEGYSVELAWLDDAFQAMKSKYGMGVWASMDLDNRFSGSQEGLFG